jgi:cell division protein FtsZ
VTEQFGRDSHVIMGAVIDETMAGRVEVCVLGTTDIGSRVNTRRPLAPARPRPVAAPTSLSAELEAPAPAVPSETPTTAPAKAGAKATKAAGGPQLSLELPAVPTQQNEFSFNELESRGYFDKTDRNLFEGQDLDVPTYLRRGIKIAL